MVLFISAIALGVLSGVLQLLGYSYYIKKIKLGRIRPNTASWSIWAFGAVLESASYVGVTGDWVKNILPIVCALSAVFIFFYCLRFRHFTWPSRFEWSILFLDVIAILIWWYYSSALYANFFLVMTAIISFVPIVVNAWRDPTTEDALPWYIWTFAYATLMLVVFLRWEKWEDLIYPLIFTVLHLLVAYLALDKRVVKFPKTKII